MSVQVGLDSIYYALLTSDPVGGSPTWDTPVRMAGAITANINPNASNETLFYDDGPGETASTTGQISLELNVADLPLSVQAVLLGHTIVGGVIERGANDIPPFVAIGFRSLKSNGKYRYTWLYKGKFSQPEQKNETKGDKINFQTPTIAGSFLKLDSTGKWQKQTDEDEADFVQATADNWFVSPAGSADTTPATVSCVPADAATGVSVSANIVFTFNEAICKSDVNKQNFLVLKADGTPVAGALSVNAAATVVTFDPDSNMDAATAYLAIVTTGVRNLAGIRMANVNAFNFTTA